MSEGIGKVGINQDRDSISIWNVYMPLDVEREDYIKTCFLTGTVTVINENGESNHKVKIGRLNLQLVNFPKDINSLGSQVICVSAPYSGKLYVIDVYTNSSEFYDQEEDQYRLVKSSDTGIAELRIDGEGKILLSVDSENSDSGEVTISITNKDRNGKLNININGELNIINDGKVFLQTTKEIEIEHKGEDTITSINIQKQLVKVSTDKLVINSDSEPMLLGQKTIDTILSPLLDQLQKESAGPYPLLGASIYGQIKSKIDEIKSKKSFLD